MTDYTRYETAGYVYRPDIDVSDFDDDRIRPLVKCVRCGSLVNSGGLSREKHDAFHEALAGLFENVETINQERTEYTGE